MHPLFTLKSLWGAILELSITNLIKMDGTTQKLEENA